MLLDIVNYIAEFYPLYRASEDAGFGIWAQNFRSIVPSTTKEK